MRELKLKEERKNKLKRFCLNWNLTLSLEWLDEVLTHPSNKNEKKVEDQSKDYEYWETLGDAVLDLLVLDILIFDFKIDNEGLLTTIRANLVSNDALVSLEEKINLKDLLKTGSKYDIQTSDQSDIVEAFFGLLFKTYDTTFCKDFFYQLNKDNITKLVKQSQDVFNQKGRLAINPKNTLQEYCQKNSLLVPDYILISEEGVPHDKFFEFECQIHLLDGQLISTRGFGKNKKAAEMDAAIKACQKLEL